MKKLSALVLIATVLMISLIGCNPEVVVEVEPVIEQDSVVVVIDSTIIIADSTIVDSVN